MGVVVMPVYVPFLTDRGLAVGDVLSLQSIFAVAVMLFEIPTGYICDVLGRRETILIGAALNLAGLVDGGQNPRLFGAEVVRWVSDVGAAAPTSDTHRTTRPATVACLLSSFGEVSAGAWGIVG